MTKAPTKVIDPASVTPRTGSRYPVPFQSEVAARERRALGDAAGLTQFGVGLTRLPPGCASAHRHWHSREDEFVYVVSGELTLVTDAGEQLLTPGMAAGFPAGNGDGHQLVNRSGADAVYLEIGSRIEGDEVDYPDIDMLVRLIDGKERYVRKNGTPY